MRPVISSALALLSLAASGAASAEVPRVVTDIPPVGALVAQVMGDLGQPQVLLTAGADPHDFQLRPSQARALADAALVVWIGPELTPWLARAPGGRGARRLALLEAPGTWRRSLDAAGQGQDHAHAAEAGPDPVTHDGAKAGDGGQASSGTDPHAWLDPGNAAVWLGLIAAELSRLDPGNAGIYDANATRAAGDLAALDKAIAARLAPVGDRPFVTFHDAYGYFTDHYRLSPLGAIAQGGAVAPGAARLQALQAELAGRKLCLFPEVQHDARLVEAMARDAGAKLGAPLDPEGTGLGPGAGAYAALLNGLADTLVACLAE